MVVSFSVNSVGVKDEIPASMGGSGVTGAGAAIGATGAATDAIGAATGASVAIGADAATGAGVVVAEMPRPT